MRTMSCGRSEAEAGSRHGAIYIHLICQTSRNDGIDTVRLSRETRARAIIEVNGISKELMLRAGKYITRVWEGGQPEAILEPRVPANVVDVDVRDQNKIDILRLNACSRQMIQIRGFKVIEIW